MNNDNEVSWTVSPFETPGQRMLREKERLEQHRTLAEELQEARDETIRAQEVAQVGVGLSPLTEQLRASLFAGKSPYEVAQMFIGVKEETHKGALNELIDTFHDTTTLSSGTAADSWCSSFVNFCTVMAGQWSSGSPAARSWLRHPDVVRGNPQRWGEGSILIFKRGRSDWQGHVTFAAEDYRGGQYIPCFGGNQNNSVCVKQYRASDLLGVIYAD